MDHGIGDGTQQHVDYIYLGIDLHKEASLHQQVAGPKSPKFKNQCHPASLATWCIAWVKAQPSMGPWSAIENISMRSVLGTPVTQYIFQTIEAQLCRKLIHNLSGAIRSKRAPISLQVLHVSLNDCVSNESCSTRLGTVNDVVPQRVYHSSEIHLWFLTNIPVFCTNVGNRCIIMI